jgi:hypothetical protein
MRSGIDTQFGFIGEGTFGTYATPTRFLPFVDEAIQLQIDRDESKSLRSAQLYDRTDQWAAGKRAAAGDMNFEVANKGFGLLLKHCGGTSASAASGTGFKYTITPGDLFGLSATMQIGRPDIANTIQPYSYLGCKIIEWELSQKISEFLNLKASINAQDETTSQTLATATAPAETEVFHWSMLALTVGGSAFDAIDFSFKNVNALKVDRFHLRGARLAKEPITNAKRMATGSLQGDFESLTAYNRYVNGTVVPIVATWTGTTTYDTALFHKLVLTLTNCRFDGDTPNVKNADVLAQTLPFKVLDDGTNPVWKIEYYTGDSSI